MRDLAFFNPGNLIDEVQRRPGLYCSEQPAEREEKLALWKEVGAAIFADWDTYNKATAYDKVLQLQRKWRSLRDAYNRELRSRRTGVRTNRKVYKYFRKMSFLGGFEGSVSDEEPNQDQEDATESHSNAGDDLPEERERVPDSPKAKVKVKRARRKPVKRHSTSESDHAPEEIEMPVFPLEISNDGDNDSDKLFLLSFLPELRQLPLNIKMWVRAQIANVMQEAVTCHYSNTQPGSNRSGADVKRPRYDINDS